MTTTILHDPLTLEHHSNEFMWHKLIPALENAQRVKNIVGALEEAGLPIKLVHLDPAHPPAIPTTIHSEAYVAHLSEIFATLLQLGSVDPDGCILPEAFPHRRFASNANGDHHTKTKLPPNDPSARLGYYSFDMSAGISKDTFTSVMAAVNLALKGAEAILSAPSSRVFCLTRPPAHHACHDIAGGYCYINSTAVAAEYLISSTSKQVGILDLDFHHGNGTQSIFYHRQNPAYVSLHGLDQYPYYAGHADEKGDGEGLGFTANIPLPLMTSAEEYMRQLDGAITLIKDQWRVEYLVVSLGLDTYYQDPLGAFDLHEQDYVEMGRKVAALGLPTLVLLEGGYHGNIGNLVVNFIQGLQT